MRYLEILLCIEPRGPRARADPRAPNQSRAARPFTNRSTDALHHPHTDAVECKFTPTFTPQNQTINCALSLFECCIWLLSVTSTNERKRKRPFSSPGMATSFLKLTGHANLIQVLQRCKARAYSILFLRWVEKPKPLWLMCGLFLIIQ